VPGITAMVPEVKATPLPGLLVKSSETDSVSVPFAVMGQLQHSSSSWLASKT